MYLQFRHFLDSILAIPVTFLGQPELQNLKANQDRLEIEIIQFEEEAAKFQDAEKIRLAEGNEMKAKQAKEIEAVNKMIYTFEIDTMYK